MAPILSRTRHDTAVEPIRAGSFRWQGRTLAYEELGGGERTVVLLPGLLLDARSNRGMARRLAATGLHVVSLDLLGHGRSDRPPHASEYRMDVYATQVVALLDHLQVPNAALVGTSLGANVSLILATRHPERVWGLVLEMPVLEWAVPSAALAFVPLLLAVHYAAPVVRLVGALAGVVPKGIDLLDSALAPLMAPPDATAAVLHGILVGPIAPTIDQRRSLRTPTLVIGHRNDLIHPFSDAERVAELLPTARLVTARSLIERRLRPARLIDEILTFLDSCWPSTVEREDRP